MNLLPVQLVPEGDLTRVHLIAADRSMTWTMPAGAAPRESPESGQVELGVRPEAIAVQPPGALPASAWSPILDAHVRGLEFNGHEVLATLSLGPHRMMARLATSLPIHDRQHLRVSLDLSRAVWFEAESGKVLESG
jgi:multiple sugar transport system ATP-binding protein